MKPTREARIYAEAAGQAIAFGYCVTCCDIFNTPMTDGFIHNVREPREARWAVTRVFTKDSFEHWKHMMDMAEHLAIERGHDQCHYGVAITHQDGTVSMNLIRHYYSQYSALGGAEAEMTESSIRELRAWDRPIRLEDHGKVPGTDSFWECRQKGEYDFIPYDDGYNRRND